MTTSSSSDIIEMKELILQIGYKSLRWDALSQYIGTLERAIIFYTRCTLCGSENLPNKCKKALADLFSREYNGEMDVWLKEIMFLTHPKPRDDAQSELFEALKQYEGESDV
jgi:hypothetical protein